MEHDSRIVLEHGVRIDADRGYWIGPCEQAHAFDSSLCAALIAFFLREGGSVGDFGAGLAHYVRAMREAGIDCEGFDGNPATPELSNGVASALDLSQPADLPRRFDWALSLEVGEPIPRPFERAFIDNLHRHNRRGMVISWAVPGQVGTGHFNNRSNDEVRALIHELGYGSDLTSQSVLRASSTASWFRNTIMVFRRI